MENLIKSEPAFNLNPAQARTLRSCYYTDPAIHLNELNTIFSHSWLYACHKSQLPDVGSFVTVQVPAEELFLIRGKDEVVRAFYNVCPHRAHPLVSGVGEKKMIVCPYHAWSFYPNGELCNARGTKEMTNFCGSDNSLKSVRVEEFLGFYFVNLDNNAKPLSEQTGNLEKEIREFVPELDNLQFAHRMAYDIKSNWKVVIDNYLECYHCSPTHPDFVNMVDMCSYRSKTYDIYSSHIGNISKSDNTAYSIQSSQQTVFGGWWLWPNVSFTVFPGKSNITIMNMMPAGPERTLENFDFFLLEPTPSSEEQAAIDYIREKLQPEDVALCENVQKGLHSRAYQQGTLVIDPERKENSEHSIHHFHSLVWQSLHP